MSSETKILKCLINIRKDSLKLTRHEGDISECSSETNGSRYNIEFIFDCDVDICIEIFYFVKEKLSNDSLNYAKTITDAPYYKSHAYKAGTKIQFKQNDHFIVPSAYDVLNVKLKAFFLFSRIKLHVEFLVASRAINSNISNCDFMYTNR